MQKKQRSNLIFWSVSILVIIGLIAAIVAVQKHQEGSSAPPIEESETTAAKEKPVHLAPDNTGDASTIVLELFNPTDRALDKPENEATIRQNIEQILSTSFTLSSCGLLDSEISRNSFRASVAYAIDTQYAKDGRDAVSKISSIQSAASANHKMLYRNTDCKDPKLALIAKQVRDWQDHYLKEK